MRTTDIVRHGRRVVRRRMLTATQLEWRGRRRILERRLLLLLLLLR